MKNVDFFIIGAPKCGTTSLVSYLAGHREIAFLGRKEPNFFCTDLKGMRRTSEIRTLADYEALYPDSAGKITGEGSTTYLFSKEAVPTILDYNRDARFIVMLRNPVNMVYSWHAQKVKEHNENVIDFAKAWRLQEARKEGSAMPELCYEPEFLQYRKWALFGQQLQRLAGIVDSDRYRVIFFDDLVADARRVYRDVLAFLGLEDDGRTEFKTHNPYAACRNYAVDEFRIRLNRLRRRNPVLNFLHARVMRFFNLEGIGFQKAFLALNYKKAERAGLDEAFRKELVLVFRDDICLVENLTGRDLAHWKV